MERTKRKRRPVREKKFEKAMEIAMNKVAKMNEQSDKRYVELEEKRLQLDEHMMEMEQRQRREDREFQLKVCQI